MVENQTFSNSLLARLPRNSLRERAIWKLPTDASHAACLMLGEYSFMCKQNTGKSMTETDRLSAVCPLLLAGITFRFQASRVSNSAADWTDVLSHFSLDSSGSEVTTSQGRKGIWDV